jgi:hypothetical protein
MADLCHRAIAKGDIGIMETINSRKAVIYAALMALFVLPGCLPDDDSVRERKLANFASTQAASYAANLSSYAVQSQRIFSARLAEGTLTEGPIGSSDDDMMRSGYCQQGGETPNHILFTWYSASDNRGNFSIKGLGTGAGSSIVHELARRSPPNTIGYYDQGDVKLRGPRTNGETMLSVPCALPIPDGSPVIVIESVSTTGADVGAGDSYEYQTLACADSNDIGMLTQRRAITTHADGSITRGGWVNYDTTCDGQVSVRNIEIATGESANLVGALNGQTGRLKNSLETLNNIRCVKSSTGRKLEDESEDEQRENLTGDCDNQGIDISRYTGPDLSERTDLIEDVERAEVMCGGEAAGSRSMSLTYNGHAVSGTVQYGAWDGMATYIRNIYRAEYDAGEGSGGKKGGVTDIRGAWMGDTISCQRPETLTISCNQAYPDYRNTSIYTPVTTGGLVLGRTNRIEGWRNAQNLEPNSPLSNDIGWARRSVSCAWDEIRTFTNCPAGFTLEQPGRNLRRVRMSASEQLIVEEWRADTPMLCKKIQEDVRECPPRPGSCEEQGCGGN